jgi:TRAP-type mannitol/chloroaromatic compound transport system permease small subunit
MNYLLALSRQIDRMSWTAAQLAALLVLVCAFISVGNALSRYLFDLSSNAWLEMQWYLFAAIVMLGAAHLLCTNGHIRVDLLYLRLHQRQRTMLDLFGLVFFVIPFSIMMVLYAWPWFVEAWLIGETSANAGGLIRWPVKILMPIGFGLLILQAISEIIKRVAALQGKTSLDVHYQRPEQ